jgi:hypothetical protein
MPGGALLGDKVHALEKVCEQLQLVEHARALSRAWAAYPAPPLVNPFAVQALLRAVERASEAVEAAAAALPAKSRAADPLRQAAAVALAMPLPSQAMARPPETSCEDCGGALNVVQRDHRDAVCLACGREQAVVIWTEDERVEHAPRIDSPSHEKSVALYLRRLQGHGRDPFALEPADRAALLECARRARVNGRNVSAQWMRDALQETKLTAFNDRIPAIMQELFRIEVPQLSIEEERDIAGKINTDIRDYLAMKMEKSTQGQRRNAPPCAYLAYRHLDALLPPGDHRRVLLNFIHLQERRTFESHEEDYWEMCRKHGRPFFNIGPPVPGPFNVRPRPLTR